MPGEQEGEGADVVLVAVRQDDAVDRAAVVEELHVGDDDVDAEVLGAGEHHAGVDDETVPAVAVDHQVHPELAEAAERDDLERDASCNGPPDEVYQRGRGHAARERDERLRGHGLGAERPVDSRVRSRSARALRLVARERRAQVLQDRLAPLRERRAQHRLETARRDPRRPARSPARVHRVTVETTSGRGRNAPGGRSNRRSIRYARPASTVSGP